MAWLKYHIPLAFILLFFALTPLALALVNSKEPQNSFATSGSITHKLKGEFPGDRFGYGVSHAGDFNNDGHGDFIVGAPAYDGGAGKSSGKIYVFSGKDYGLLFSKEGENAGDQFGHGVSYAGDIDGDGKGDILVGSPNFDGKNGSNSGKIYVYSGEDQKLIFSKEGEYQNNHLGYSVSYAGDVNNDNKMDIIVGAVEYDSDNRQGISKAYVILNPGTLGGGQSRSLAFVDTKSPKKIPSKKLKGSLLFEQTGRGSNNYFGRSFSHVGDLNNDGNDDLVVGADGGDYSSEGSSGEIHIFSGRDRKNPLIKTYKSGGRGGHVALNVANAGDTDGDGKDDIVIGSYRHSGVNGEHSGKVYVISGDNGKVLFSKEGENANDMFGIFIIGIGDINKDGKTDIASSSIYFDGSAGENCGKVYILSGADGQLLMSIEGRNKGDMFGNSIADINDIDRDGISDLAVAAFRHDGKKGRDSGIVYLFSGATMELILSKEGESSGARFGNAIANIKDLDKDGKSELIVGANLHTGKSKQGATGKIYVLSTKSPDELITLFESVGENTNDNYGKSVTSVNDLNRDGLPEIVVGASLYDGKAGKDTGKIYVYSGRNFELLYSKEGEVIGERFGNTVGTINDFNGDNSADIVVGAHRHQADDKENIGKIYIYSVR